MKRRGRTYIRRRRKDSCRRGSHPPLFPLVKAFWNLANWEFAARNLG